jgi:trehalose-6-phosphate hydrolase
LIAREHPSVYAYWRHGDGEALLVVNNFSGAPTTMEVPPEVSRYRSREVLISNEEAPGQQSAGSFHIRPYESFVLHLTDAG